MADYFSMSISNSEDTVSTSRLKAVQEDPEVRPAEPRPRGRPRKSPVTTPGPSKQVHFHAAAPSLHGLQEVSTP